MKLILLELNEINFDYVKKYIQNGVSLPAFSKIIDDGLIETSSEEVYENIEPWIQWPSVHIGKTYEDHKVFRLGDIVNFRHEQIFEKIESKGYKVGAVSPMNAANNLKNPEYFIPDPWTDTNPSRGFVIKSFSDALKQSVNDNSKGKLTLKTLIALVLSFLIHVRISKKFDLIKYALSCIKDPWKKSIFLDMFIYEVHRSLFKKNNPDFSTLFLNGGAHIQHHYFLNSSVIDKNISNPDWYINYKKDPLRELLIQYDKILDDLVNDNDVELILATGLSQVPYDRVKFYYRLFDHTKFLDALGVNYTYVQPRMTRDFLIGFSSNDEKARTLNVLKNLKNNKEELLFTKIEDRNCELFVTFTYPKEINKNDFIDFNNKKIFLKDQTVFVAIKNGMHSQKGFSYFSKGIKEFEIKQNDHVSSIHQSILNILN